jgi:hypothetical protein
MNSIMSFSSDHSLKPTTQARRIALAMVAVLWLLVGLQLHRDWDAALEQGGRLVDAMANASEQQLAGSIRSLHSLLEEAADGAEAGRWDSSEFIETMTTRLQEFPEVRFITRVDRDGRLRSNTIPFKALPEGGLDVSDRGY